MFSKPYKMVLVEDDEDTCDMLEELIHNMYPNVFTIKTFQDPDKALIFMKSLDPQIVITDLRMPGRYGDSILSEIRSQNSGIISILITGYPNFSALVSSYRNGIHGFLVKPIGKENLKRVLDPSLALLEQWEDSLTAYSQKKGPRVELG